MCKCNYLSCRLVATTWVVKYSYNTSFQLLNKMESDPQKKVLKAEDCVAGKKSDVIEFN